MRGEVGAEERRRGKKSWGWEIVWGFGNASMGLGKFRHGAWEKKTSHLSPRRKTCPAIARQLLTNSPSPSILHQITPRLVHFHPQSPLRPPLPSARAWMP